MIATSDLLEQIKGLKARISRLGPTPGAASLKDAGLLAVAATAAGPANTVQEKELGSLKSKKELSTGNPPQELKAAHHGTAATAPIAMGNLGKLGWRARRILETGLDLTATLKSWQQRGEHNESGLDLVLHPEEFAETVALADGSLRLLGLFPESQTEQNALCEGLEIVLIHLRRRVAFWDRKWELVRSQQSRLTQLKHLARSSEASSADLLQAWRDCAGEFVAAAKKTGLGYWVDRTSKDPLGDWAESTANLGDLTARFALHLDLPEKEIRSLVLAAILATLVHAQMPGYLHGKTIWEENDRNWYAQWHRQQTDSLPEALKPWVNQEPLGADQKSILELLRKFNALQLSRPDRPGLGPLGALLHQEKERKPASDSHWRALATFLEKEGTLIEAGSLGAGLIWTSESAPKSPALAAVESPKPPSGLRALILGPVDAGSAPSQGPYWVSLAGGFGGAVKELTGTKRARWHIQLLAGSADHA